VSKKKSPTVSWDILNHFDQDSRRERDAADVVDRLLGITPPRSPLPEDMPAMERIKIYARAGFKQYHIGTDEDFERAWAEAFPKEEKGGRA
jgi:hypothetical protein